MSAEAGHRALVWGRASQVSLVRAVAGRAGLEVVAAGGPEADGGRAAAAALGAEHAGDLRAALSTGGFGVVLLADPGGFGDGSAPEDAQLLSGLGARGTRVVSLEPLPAALVAAPPRVASGPGPDGGGWVRAAPVVLAGAARAQRAFCEAAELLEQFGPVRAATITCLGHASEGSLGARLFDGLDVAGLFLGVAETIDAAYVSDQAGRAVHALPGESLRGLRGDITANLRFADGRAASVFASDRAGQWVRSATLVGGNGVLGVSDAGLEWVDAQGRRVDRTGAGAGGHAEVGGGALGAALIAATVRGVVESRGGGAGGVGGGGVDPRAFVRTLASAQAALLSARTRDGEHPGTLLRMAGLDDEA